LGWSGAPLGAPGRGLGELLGPLRRFLGRPREAKTTFKKNIDFKNEKGGRLNNIWVPYGLSKSMKNETRNETKIKIIFNIQKNALQDRLGAVLGRS